MSCCDGERTIRKQVIESKPKTKKQAVVQRVKRTPPNGNQQRQITVSRQHVAANQKCQKCGYPTMVVSIAGKERLQCSNSNCKVILR